MKIKYLKEILNFNRYEFNKFMEKNSYPETSPQVENWGRIISDRLIDYIVFTCKINLTQEMKKELEIIENELNNYKAQNLAIKFIQNNSE